MNVVAFKSREFAARIGAVAAALVMAFSLVSLTAPARADGELDMKIWVEYSFSGDNITFSYRYHNTMQGSGHKTMCNKHENSGAYDGVVKYVITQYEGVEVCERLTSTLALVLFLLVLGKMISFTVKAPTLSMKAIWLSSLMLLALSLWFTRSLLLVASFLLRVLKSAVILQSSSLAAISR